MFPATTIPHAARRPLALGLATLALSLLLSPRAIAADDPAFRPLSFPSLSLAKAKTFGADFYVDDRDRDPWGIDVFDTGFRFRYQAGDNTEFFGDAIVDRVVALPEAPAIPSSPRDLVFAGPSRMIPNAFSGAHPYLDKRGDARFDAFIPGLVTIGVTRTLRREGFALGLSASLAIPLAGSLNALRSGANSGRPDAALALAGSHDLMGGRLHGRVGYTLAGNGSWPDRSFSVSGNTVSVTETGGTGRIGRLGRSWRRVRRASRVRGSTRRSRARRTGPSPHGPAARADVRPARPCGSPRPRRSRAGRRRRRPSRWRRRRAPRKGRSRIPPRPGHRPPPPA